MLKFSLSIIPFDFISICFCGLILIGCQKDRSIIQPDNLPVPQLNNPQNNSSGVPINTVLKWECRETTWYRVLLDTLPFPQNIINTNVDEDSLLVYGLKFNKTYYWQVIAFFENGDSVISKIWQFRTKRILPLTLSNIDIYYPKVDLRVYWFWHWNDFDGSYQRSDTLRDFFQFSFNPYNFPIDNIEYTSENDELYLSVFKTSNTGPHFKKDSLSGYIKLDTANQKMRLKLYFHIQDDYIMDEYNYDKQLTESSIEMFDLPYVIDNKGILHADFTNSNITSMINVFQFKFYRNQWADFEFGGERLELLEFFGFEKNANPNIKIIF